MDFYFSYHGCHSHPYSLHAKGNLEEMIKEAIKKGFKYLGLTEHMPRKNPKDLYPEEINANITTKDLFKNFEDYVNKAYEFKEKYKDKIEILVGMEIEATDLNDVAALKSKYILDFLVGSIHHVNGIPIDFDKKTYQKAIEKSGSEKRLWIDYFKEQKNMLVTIKPEIVGHFDLIRLFSFKDYSEECAENIEKNLKFIKEYGGIIDINTRAYKKGSNEPYPNKKILKKILELKIPVTLGDDSHDISEIGYEFDRAIEFLKKIGFKKLTYLSKHNSTLIHNNIKL